MLLNGLFVVKLGQTWKSKCWDEEVANCHSINSITTSLGGREYRDFFQWSKPEQASNKPTSLRAPKVETHPSCNIMGINYHSLGGWSSWQLAIALQAATTATNLDIARRSGLNPSSKSDPSPLSYKNNSRKK